MESVPERLVSSEYRYLREELTVKKLRRRIGRLRIMNDRFTTRDGILKNVRSQLGLLVRVLTLVNSGGSRALWDLEGVRLQIEDRER